MDKSIEGLSAQDVSSSAAHVAVLHVGPILAPEPDRLRRVVVPDHVAQVLHNDERVIVGLNRDLCSVDALNMNRCHISKLYNHNTRLSNRDLL